MIRAPSQHWLAYLTALSLGAGCAPQRLPAHGGAGALATNLARAGRVELHVPVEMQELALSLVAGWDWPTEVLSPGAQGSAQAVRVIAGPPESAEVARLLETLDLPLDLDAWTADELAVANRSLSWEGTALIVVAADPAREGLPVTLAVARDVAVLEASLRRLRPGSRPQLIVTRRGLRVFEALLSPSGRLRPESVLDHDPPLWERARGWKRVSLQPAGVRALIPLDLELSAAEAVAAELTRGLARARSWAGGDASWPLELVLAETPEDLNPGMALQQTSVGESQGGSLRVLLGPGLSVNGAPSITAFLRDTLGPPSGEWLMQAAALDATDRFGGRELEEWCAHLARLQSLGAIPTDTRQLLRADAVARWSPLAIEPLRALLFRALREREGGVWLQELWSGAGDGSSSPTSEWSALLAARLEECTRDHPQESADRRQASLAGGWYGWTLDVPFGPSRAGLGSAACLASLSEMRAVGAQVVSLRCHLIDPLVASTSVWDDGGPLSSPRRWGVREGDAALLSTLRRAKALGLRVCLCPSLLAAPTGVLDGERVLVTERSWREFFTSLRGGLLHVALLAELAGADLLCIGSGQAETARTLWASDAPEGEAQVRARAIKGEGWRRCIGISKAAFRGPLAYALDRPGQCDWIDFWSDLDVLGLRAELNVSGEMPNAALRLERVRHRCEALFETCMQLAQKSGRPVLIQDLSLAGLPASTIGAGLDRSGSRRARGKLQSEAQVLTALASVLDKAPRGTLPLGIVFEGWGGEQAARRRVGLSLKGNAAGAALKRVFSR